jgi:hypothetical protein
MLVKWAFWIAFSLLLLLLAVLYLPAVLFVCRIFSASETMGLGIVNARRRQKVGAAGRAMERVPIPPAPPARAHPRPRYKAVRRAAEGSPVRSGNKKKLRVLGGPKFSKASRY